MAKFELVCGANLVFNYFRGPQPPLDFNHSAWEPYLRCPLSPVATRCRVKDAVKSGG